MLSKETIGNQIVSTTIIESDLNRLIYKTFQEVLDRPQKESRNGTTRSIENLNLFLENPRGRWLNLPGRKSNVFALVTETMWMLSGSDRIDGLLSFILPRAPDFSDDGKTWRGAYGPRIYNQEALQNIVEILQKDKNSRRAVLNIFDSNLDTSMSLQQVYGIESSKDIPCNNLLNFYITNNKLNLKVFSRSGDVIWGLGSINIFSWTVLQELVYEILKKTYPELELGYYHHTTTDAHIYDQGSGPATINQAVSVVQNPIPDPEQNDSELNSGFKSVGQMKNFATSWVAACDKYIGGQGDAEDIMDVVYKLDDGLLKTMLVLTTHQIMARYGDIDYVDLCELLNYEENEFTRAAIASPFRKFEVK